MGAVIVTKSMGGIALDVVVEEQHTSTLNITRMPVERGADISDHAYLEPRTLTLRGVAGRRLGTASSVRVESPSETYARILRLQQTLEPFDVQSGLLLYRSMLIRSITVSRREDTASVLEFTAELQEVRFAGASRAITVGAAKGGIAVALSAEVLLPNTLTVGVSVTADMTPYLRAAPSVQRGDSVLRATVLDASTREGMNNLRSIGVAVPRVQEVLDAATTVTSDVAQAINTAVAGVVDSVQTVSLNGATGQAFSAVFNGVRHEFSFRYNPAIERFVVDIAKGGQRALTGAVLSGATDALRNAAALDIGELVAVPKNAAQAVAPTLQAIRDGQVNVYLAKLKAVASSTGISIA